MNTILRSITRTGNHLYQISRIQQPSIKGLSIRAKQNLGEEKDVSKIKKILQQKKAEEPTKKWVLYNGKVTNMETIEEERARTIMMEGQLTEEIESGSELPALDVINKVFSILGYSPEIEEWNQLGEGAGSGARLISVKLANVDDALKLVKDQVSLLRDHEKLHLNIKRSAADNEARRAHIVKMISIQEKKQKYQEREEERARTVMMTGQLTEEIESGCELPALDVINKVFSILGYSPEIEEWNQLGERAGVRLISVKLANVDDALKLVKDRRSLRDHGKLYLNIKWSAADNEAHKAHIVKMKSIEEKTQKYQERRREREEERARTIIMNGQLTEEIESGSELPALDVINKVFSILGYAYPHIPEIEEWDQSSTQFGERAGARLISVKLANVDDALKLVKDRVSLKDHGKIYISIKRSAAENEARFKLSLEKKQRIIKDPSKYYFIGKGKVHYKSFD